MVHLLPHWNFAGREGEPIEVWAYTNCEKVALYVNGALFGEKDVERYGHAEFAVPYEPGCIEARGIRGGEVVCADRVETTGAAVRLRLTCNTPGVRADGRDVMLLTCDCVDAQGRHVPDATPMVRFSTSLPSRIRLTVAPGSTRPITSKFTGMSPSILMMSFFPHFRLVTFIRMAAGDSSSPSPKSS